MNKIEHLLSCLAEESAEVVQAAMKIHRFGQHDGYPGTDRTNIGDLAHELDDLAGVVSMLRAEGILPPEDHNRVQAKVLKVERFMEHARKTGALECHTTDVTEPETD